MIVPVIYYHGSQDWEPKSIIDTFGYIPDAFKKYVPEFGYIFQNIKLLSDEEIKNLENNLLVPGLLIQKYFKDLIKLKDLLETIFHQLSLIDDEGNYKKNYYVYIFELFDREKDTLMKIIDEMEYPTKDSTKNYILQLEQKGIEKGMEKAISKLLTKGHSVEFICDVMDVSPEYVDKIKRMP